MTTLASNSAVTSPAASSRRGRRLVFILPIILIVAGLGLVSYPFLPALQYRLSKPTPTIPYQTKLSQQPSSAWDALGGLPTIGSKPIPTDNRLVIPSIGVDMSIHEGPTQKTLDRGGIWHLPNTSDPLRGGNMVLSGHRWQYLPPSNSTLYLLDKVADGELVIVYWQGKEYDYRIASREVVNPDRVDILNDTTTPRLTIFTCTPLFSTKQRLVLYGELLTS